MLRPERSETEGLGRSRRLRFRLFTGEFRRRVQSHSVTDGKPTRYSGVNNDWFLLILQHVQRRRRPLRGQVWIRSFALRVPFRERQLEESH